MSPTRTAVFRCLLWAAGLALGHDATTSFAQEWTRFRGPNGSGLGRADKLPARWTDADYAWRVSLPGVGHSSPVLWGEKLFLTSGDEETGTRTVLCFQAETGEKLWSRGFASQTHGKHELNNFASATPATDGDRVYCCWATPREYVVLALNHEGDLVWRADLGPYKAGHGHGVSPIVHDGMLIVPNEQDGQSSLVALEAGTGKLRWSVPRESQTTYSTPCVYQSSGQPALLIFTNWNYGITAHDPATGMQLWQAKVFGPTQIETAIGSPIVAGDVIIGTCGWLGRDIHVVGVRPPRDEHPPQTVFHFSRGTPLSTTPLVLGDLLFMWSDGGIVTCADVQTGEVHWKERVGGTFYSSPVAAAGRIYNVSVDGQVVVLAGGKEFAELGRMELGEPANATPAIARDKMYLRTVSQLFCLPGK